VTGDAHYSVEDGISHRLLAGTTTSLTIDDATIYVQVGDEQQFLRDLMKCFPQSVVAEATGITPITIPAETSTVTTPPGLRVTAFSY